jgi:hypothetical protein
VPIDGHVGGLGAIHHRPFPMASGEMDPAEFAAFLGQVCANLAAFSRDGSLHFICIDWRHIGELLAAGRAVYTEVKNLCVWVKGSGGMGSLYRSEHELVFVFKYGNYGHRNNVQLGRFGRPRGSKNLRTLLNEALNELVVVTEEGGRRKITKREAIITQLVNRSASADLRALKILLDTLRDIEGQSEPDSSETSGFTVADEKVIEQLRARFSTPKTG